MYKVKIRILSTTYKKSMAQTSSKYIWEGIEDLLTPSVDLSTKQDTEKYLLRLLDTELNLYTFTLAQPAICDKWTAVSNLHKSIRRREIRTALSAAATLIQIDPDYLFRRLKILAYEDIGIANPILCLMTLFASKKVVLNTYGLEKVAYYLVEKMSQSDKSRTATDIISFTVSDPSAPMYLSTTLNARIESLINVVLDKDLKLFQVFRKDSRMAFTALYVSPAQTS